MKGIKHYYQVNIIQWIVLFILTISQSYLSLLDTAALSCHCPHCGLWETVLFDSFIAVIILSTVLSAVEKMVHRAHIRLYLHMVIVLVVWLTMTIRLFFERSNCDGSANLIDILTSSAIPALVGVALYLPIYRWARKQIALLTH